MAQQQAHSLTDVFQRQLSFQPRQQQTQSSHYSCFFANSQQSVSSQLPSQYGQDYANHNYDYLTNSSQPHFQSLSTSQFLHSQSSPSAAGTLMPARTTPHNHDFLSMLAELNSLQARYRPIADNWSQQQQTVLTQIAVLAMSGVPLAITTGLVHQESKDNSDNKIPEQCDETEGITAAVTMNSVKREATKLLRSGDASSQVKAKLSSSPSSFAKTAVSSRSSSTATTTQQQLSPSRQRQAWKHKGSHQPNYLKNPLPDFPKRPVSYLLFKSYDQHDIDLSQKGSIWATLPKNQDRINHIFDHSDKVVVFFSVNGSRAFQGWAEMLCGIGRELTDTEWLKADGSAAWGEVFRVRWISTNPLPFEKIPPTIKNKWNNNKLVKIGYDGTEQILSQERNFRICSFRT